MSASLVTLSEGFPSPMPVPMNLDDFVSRSSVAELYLDMLNRFILGAIVFAALAPSIIGQVANAAPPACKRWQNSLSDCEILGKLQGCTVSLAEKEKVNHERNAAAAKSACKQLVKTRFPTVSVSTVQTWPNDSNPNNMEFEDDTNYTSARCVWDANGDGKIDWADASQTMQIVNFNNVTPEPHCFCSATGPYTGLPFDMSISGLEKWNVFVNRAFSSNLKKAVLEKNWANNGSQVGANGNVYKTDGVFKPSNIPFDDNPTLQKLDSTAYDAAEIDHIIPRTDSQGCLCGDATINNAAVVSRGMNGSMSNSSPKVDLDRANMYASYVKCDDPSVAKFAGWIKWKLKLPMDQEEIDESAMNIALEREAPIRREIPEADDEIGAAGCSTGVGGGLVGVGLALLGLGPVATSRRRTRRACLR